MNCTALDERTSFASYIARLREETGNNLTESNLEPCRREICSALYGTSNPDIAGIGVILGYGLELLLGIVLALGVMKLSSSKHGHRLYTAVHSAFSVYADAAVMLTFSVQLASIIILVRKDFGISADAVGGFTEEIAWATSLLTMLPMTLLCFVKEVGLERKQLRFTIVAISWVFFLYTFLSRMIADFGPSQVSSSQGSVIKPGELENIEALCFNGHEGLSEKEWIAFQVFAVGGSLWVSILIVAALVRAIILRQRPEWEQHRHFLTLDKKLAARKLDLLLVFSVFLWGVPQSWSILILRTVQGEMSDAFGAGDESNAWTFGQIIAAVIFLPVLIELLYVFVVESSEHAETLKSKQKIDAY